MAESELSITYADLLVEVATFLGYGSTSTAWTAAQVADCDRFVQAGVRRFYYPPAVKGSEPAYPWSFLSPVATLATVAGQASQDLAGDLGRVLGQLHFAPEQHRRAVVEVPEDRFQALKASTITSGAPVVARVRHKPKEPGVGSRLEVSWWPVPDAAYVLTYRYEAFNGKLSADNPYPLGGMRHGELIVQACLMVAEQKANDERGLHTDEFERLLVAAIEQDRRVGAQRFGDMGDRSDSASSPFYRGDASGTITYKGVDL